MESCSSTKVDAFAAETAPSTSVTLEGLSLQQVEVALEWDDWGYDDAQFVSPHIASPKRARWSDIMSNESDGEQNNVSLPSVNQVSSSSSDAGLCHSWLQSTSCLLSNYDGKLLRRYIPALSSDSLQKVVSLCESKRLTYVDVKRQQREPCGPEVQISKMAMRRVLGTTFSQLAPDHDDILQVHRQWTATDDKSHRKGKVCAEQHTEKWRRHASN